MAKENGNKQSPDEEEQNLNSKSQKKKYKSKVLEI